MLFFVTANIAAVTSRANQQYKAPGKTAFENLSPRACLRNSFYEVALGESVADCPLQDIGRFHCRKMPFVNTGRKYNRDEFQI